MTADAGSISRSSSVTTDPSRSNSAITSRSSSAGTSGAGE
jgi:hypothetical protein